MAGYVNGLPGIKTSRSTTPRDILKTDIGAVYVPANIVIDGSNSRDWNNATADVDWLRPGIILGKVYDISLEDAGTAQSNKYAPIIIGVLTKIAPASGTSITVSAASATEINRRFGSSGTSELYLVGDVDAGSGDEETTVTMEALTHSAVNTTTGVITVSAITNAFNVGSLVIAKHAVINATNAQLSNLFILNEYVKVTEQDESTSCDAYLSRALTAGVIDVDQIINYPSSNAGLQRWLKDELRDNHIGYDFSDDV